MSQRKPIFMTSDWHVFHKNVIQFSNRPFTDVDHMHRVLINNFNASVPANGVCYFLGDMGLCSTGNLKWVMDQLNSTKILIAGNHDGGINTMYNCGFNAVLHGAVLEIANQRVTLSHYPLRGIPREKLDGISTPDGTNWHGENRPVSKLHGFMYSGQFHLHGHIHSPNNGRSLTRLGRQMDVGVDGNNYRPVSISTIESWIAEVLKTENLTNP